MGFLFLGHERRRYNKPALTYPQLIQQLKDRGLIIKNEDKALHLLKNISYYRLSGYWYPLLEDKENHVFKPGSTFETAFKLYCFDRELRLLVLREIEMPEFIEGDVFKAIIPIQTGQVTGQPAGEATVEVSGEVQMVVGALQNEMKLKELMDALDLSHRENFKINYLEPATKAGFIEMTHPDSPNHPNQKYRLTEKGEKLKKRMEKK